LTVPHWTTTNWRSRRSPWIAHVRRSGTPRGAHDLIIAAHALQTERIVVTSGAKARFGDLPGVRASEP
jgi:predicted nucleic acid-binding protein